MANKEIDGGNIQQGLNGTAAGDTVTVHGTYDVGTSELIWPSNRTYLGVAAAIAARGVGKGQGHRFLGDGITFRGFALSGGGIFLDRGGGPNGRSQRITVDNNVFNLNTSGENPNGVTFTAGLIDAVLTNNLFTGYNAGFGLYGYNYRRLLISQNEFINITAGMHIDAFGDCGDLQVLLNYIVGVHGMGMEFQGTAQNLQFLNNWYEHPSLSPNPSQNGNSMAFSLILDKSSNIRIAGNTLIAPERPDGIGTRCGFELGGDNSVLEDNYVRGSNNWAVCNDNDGTHSVIVRNNNVAGFLEGDRESFPGPGRSYTASNNNPDVKLTWDPTTRTRPQRNGGGTVTTTGTTTTATTTTSTGGNTTVSSFTITATAVEVIAATATTQSLQVVDVAWTNAPAGVDDMTIAIDTPSGEPVTSVTVDAAQGSARVYNIPPGWGLRAKATALMPSTYTPIASTAPLPFTAKGTVIGSGIFPPTKLAVTGASTDQSAILAQLQSKLAKATKDAATLTADLAA